MSFTELETSDGIATVALARGKVNALDGAVVAELRSRLEELEADPEVRVRFWVGSAAATKILYSGAMMSAEEARSLGLVEEMEPEDAVVDRARRVASDLGSRPAGAFASIKALLRRPVVEEMRRREQESIREFVEIWYSAATWAKLQEIRIR